MREKAQFVLWHHETISPVTVQRKFRNDYGRPPPDVKSIKAWYSKFVETGSVGELNLLAPELFFLILAHLYIKCE